MKWASDAGYVRSDLPASAVSTAEVARRLGLTVERGRQVVAQEDFPKPIKILRQARMYDWREVEAWVKKNGMPRQYPDARYARYVRQEPRSVTKAARILRGQQRTSVASR